MSSTKPPLSSPDRFHILDLFAGPGGLDVAAHFLGVKSLGVEWDGNACETRYWAGLPTIHADVSQFRRERFHELPETINVLAGGPPCQTYSVAGHGKGRKALDRVETLLGSIVKGDRTDAEIDAKISELSPGDPRTGLVLEPLRYLLKSIDSRGPSSIKAIILEQVPAVKALWDAYADVLQYELPRNVKYVVDVKTLRTEEYGVPQTRKRTVLIARLVEHGMKNDPIKLPAPTHLPFARKSSPPKTDSPINTQPALIDMAERAKAQHQLVACVTMETALAKTRTAPYTVVSNYGQGGDPKKRGRRHSSEPAFTVTGKVSRNVVLEDDEESRKSKFTIAEAGVLQTFPADYPWRGGDLSQQVGNAVPPRFGMHVLRAALGLDSTEMPEPLTNWPEVRPQEREALRAAGCGDRSGCPNDGKHPTVIQETSGL